MQLVASWAHAKNVLLQPTHLPGRYNDWADDLSRNRLTRFAHRPGQSSPASLAQAGRGITLCPAEAPWRPEHLAAAAASGFRKHGLRQHRALAFCISRCEAFPPPEYLAATAEFAHKPQASENVLMKVAALRVQQCPRIVCHCASSRRCNPALKRGIFAPCPRKPSQATRERCAPCCRLLGSGFFMV